MRQRKAGIDNEEDRGVQPCFAKKEETNIAAHAQKKNETDKMEEEACTYTTIVRNLMRKKALLSDVV
jgi:hypothetical protein